MELGFLCTASCQACYTPETKAMKFSLITVDSRRMGGVPCIRRLRIPVATVVGMVADGMHRDEILMNFDKQVR